VPTFTVMDGAKAQVQGNFRRKLRDVGCHIKQTEHYPDKSNLGEGGVRELKRGVGWEMLRYGCPKRCWDECLVNEAYVSSHTALDIFSLEGQVHERRVKGEPSDISPMAEYAWYNWVKFHFQTPRLKWEETWALQCVLAL
jgi:hypothetical protein